MSSGHLIALVVLAYVAWALYSGEIHVKHSWRGRLCLRDEEPGWYWFQIVVYLLLADLMWFR